MKVAAPFATLAFLASTGTLAAPEASRLRDLSRRETNDASATDFSCEAPLTWITSCQSKTSAYSCYLATQQVCDLVASDRQNLGYRQASSGTCEITVSINRAPGLLFADCSRALQAINDNCVSPGERPNPHDNLPTMRGWQNVDPGNPSDPSGGCGSPVDVNQPSYEMASGNCVGKWGTGCAGGNLFGVTTHGSGGNSGGGVAPGGSHGAQAASVPGGFGEAGNVNPE